MVNPKLAFSAFKEEKNQKATSFLALSLVVVVIFFTEYKTDDRYYFDAAPFSFFLFGSTVGFLVRNVLLAYVMSIIIAKRNNTNLEPLKALPIVAFSLFPHIIGLFYDLYLHDLFEFPFVITEIWRAVIMAIGLMPLLKMNFVRSLIALGGFYFLYFLALASFMGVNI